MKLTSERVEEIILASMYTPDEIKDTTKPPDDAIVVEAIVTKFAFNPQRIEPFREEVRGLLNELPIQFHTVEVGGGGGWTFLNMHLDKHGNQWGEHPNVEQLVLLGLALKMASFPLPREYWEKMPGGMPYVALDTRVIQ